jgi:hypothetical protein
MEGLEKEALSRNKKQDLRNSAHHGTAFLIYPVGSLNAGVSSNGALPQWLRR